MPCRCGCETFGDPPKRFFASCDAPAHAIVAGWATRTTLIACSKERCKRAMAGTRSRVRAQGHASSTGRAAMSSFSRRSFRPSIWAHPPVR
eukprot:scaffold2535_cov336-Prasinococcus_capsulatus_cf.AAC.13